MNNTVIQVEPVELRRAGAAVEVLAATFEATLHALVSTLDAEGCCWGRDQVGGAFERVYVPAVDNARESFSGLRDAVWAVGQALRTVADNADAAEVRVGKRFS